MVGTIEIPGSSRSEPERAEALGEIDGAENIFLTVYPRKLRSAGSDYRQTAAHFEEFALRNELRLRSDPGHGLLHLEGTIAKATKAFATSLRRYDDGYRRFRARSGPLSAPREVVLRTLAVLGFDHRPVVPTRLTPLAANGEAGAGLWPTEVARLYGISSDHDGAGQCIGIVALGGGYLPSDLTLACAGMKRPVPLVIDYPINNVQNNFGGGDLADEEVALDLQVVAGIASRARIVVYFADNNTQSLADAIHTAVHDDVNRPGVLSISWGSAEKFWTEAARDTAMSAFKDATDRRVTIVGAAGDFLATGGVTDGAAHVLFPASSPYVLACGGTQVTLDAGGLRLKDETVWNDGFNGTGGGVSDVFEVPAYQNDISIPKSVNGGARRRGVPDVAAAANREPGYTVIVNGQTRVKEGTSAVAPLWAALITIVNSQRPSPIGLVQTHLYAGTNVCRTITQGNNRSNGIGYDAGPGWNACAGLGVPVGPDVINALIAAP